MSKLLIAILISSLLLIPTSINAESCLDTTERLLIEDISIKNNVSTVIWLEIFDNLCDKYNKQYIDSINQNVTEQLDGFDTLLKNTNKEYIRNESKTYLEEYTKWFETQVDMAKLSESLAKITDTALNKNEIISQLMQEIDEAETRALQYTDKKAGNSTATVGLTPEQYSQVNSLIISTQPKQQDYTSVIVIVVIIGIAAFLLRNKLSAGKNKTSKYGHLHDVKSGFRDSIQRYSANNPSRINDFNQRLMEKQGNEEKRDHELELEKARNARIRLEEKNRLLMELAREKMNDFSAEEPDDKPKPKKTTAKDVIKKAKDMFD